MKSNKSSDPDRWLEDHGDYLFRYAFLRLKNRDQSEEAVQETFAAALRNRSSYSGQSSERTWLTGILKHKIIDLLRKICREREMIQPPANDRDDDSINAFFDRHEHWDPKPEPWKNPASSLEEKEFYNVLHECIKKLPKKYAPVFTLRIMDDAPSEEICEIFAITAANLHVMLYRARLQMRRCLEINWFGLRNRK